MNAKDLSFDPIENSENGERLHKLLATAGIASRRECEELILAGRVEVDGQVVTELGVRVDPRQQEILVDGEKIRLGKRLYYAFYKPDGVVCTNEDPAGRSRVIDWIPTSTRIFTVGRLDLSSEGLIIVTNDGALAQRMTHPKFGIEKTYDVTVVGHPTWEDVKVLLDGVRLAEGWAKVKKLEIRKRIKDRTLLRIVLDEGKNREIRRLLARIGHKVVKLVRVGIGRLSLGLLQPGEHRELTVAEIKGLENLATKSAKEPRKPRPKPRSSEGYGDKRRSTAREGFASSRPERSSGPRTSGPRSGPARDRSERPRRDGDEGRGRKRPATTSGTSSERSFQRPGARASRPVGWRKNFTPQEANQDRPRSMDRDRSEGRDRTAGREGTEERGGRRLSRVETRGAARSERGEERSMRPVRGSRPAGRPRPERREESDGASRYAGSERPRRPRPEGAGPRESRPYPSRRPESDDDIPIVRGRGNRPTFDFESSGQDTAPRRRRPAGEGQAAPRRSPAGAARGGRRAASDRPGDGRPPRERSSGERPARREGRPARDGRASRDVRGMREDREAGDHSRGRSRSASPGGGESRRREAGPGRQSSRPSSEKPQHSFSRDAGPKGKRRGKKMVGKVKISRRPKSSD